VGCGGVIEVRNDLVNPVALLQRAPAVEGRAMSRGKSNQCVVERGFGSPPTVSAPHLPVANAQAFHAEYMEVARLQTRLSISPAGFLGIVHHGRTSGNPGGTGAIPVVSLDLPQLGDPPLAEVWTSPLPVTYHQAEGIHCAMNDAVLFGVLQVAEPPGALLDTVTYRAYRHLLMQARALGYPHLLRVWNYFPSINRESDGQERYQRFCAGRYQALAEGLEGFPRTLPAGTAVGTLSGPLTIHFLAAKHPGLHIENPRQVSAYEYPPVYGLRSPSFARATLRSSLSGAQLLIAGTASIVGHASEHVGAPYKQTLEILHNLNVLIARTEQLHGIDRGQWVGRALFKVYIRHPEQVVTIRDMLTALLPSPSQVLYLQGEMCRSELLVEIEAVLTQEQSVGVSHRVLADSSVSSATGRI
jgi:chorismate lyase / 3-hydroxybenzoate synthase